MTRVLQKAGQALVKRRLLSARQTGYRWLPSCTVQEVCQQQSTAVTVHKSSRSVSCPLPENVASREALSRKQGRYERSFYDVPELSVEGRWSATLYNVRAVRYRSQWGDDHYALITEKDQLLQLAGTGWRKEHRGVLNGNPVSRRIDSAAWVTTHSTRNHYMWLYTHLPRILMAQKLGLTDKILLPEKQLLSEAKQETLCRLGIRNPKFIQPEDEVLWFEELTVMGVDSCDPDMLNELREKLTSPMIPREQTRRVLISREKCSYRKLENETVVLEALKPYGFKKHLFEEMTLQAQIDLLQSTAILLGAHGAGFANLVFCNPGTKVLEIQDPEDPNPHFYMLASLLGLPYWLVHANVDEGKKPHYRDLDVEIEKLMSIIENSL